MTGLYKYVLWVLFVGLLSSCSHQDKQDTLREISQGKLVGTQKKGVFIWKGIPFAKAPIGTLRWKAPQKPDAWEGVYEAHEFKEMCFQSEINLDFSAKKTFSGSEDCLYLNIYAPKLNEKDTIDKKMPVMMWIHGGGNTIGSAKGYNPSEMVNRFNVVVVTVQYRMSILGWFRHPALQALSENREDRSGNFGTLDTIMALKWIRNHIKAFGGDPKNITIYGESAGGHNVAALLASPLAQGLFHKAIVQSGIFSHADANQAERYYPKSGISGTVSSKEMLNYLLIQDKKAANQKEAKALQEKMSSRELADYLRSKSAKDILLAQREVRPKLVGMARVFNDGYVMYKKGIREAILDNTFNKVPIILGTNLYENKLFNMMNPAFVEWGKGQTLLGRVATFFMPSVPRKIYNVDTYNAFNHYGADQWKLKAVDRPARALFRVGHKDVFAYRFDWQDLPHFNDVSMRDLIGAAHALETLFLFNAHIKDNMILKVLFDKEAYLGAKQLSKEMMSYWTHFAYTGNPSKGRDGDQPEWLSWSKENKTYLILDSKEGQGIQMASKQTTLKSILADLHQDIRLSKKEKCKILFNGANEEDGIAWHYFEQFENRFCQSIDKKYFESKRDF